MAYFKTNLIQKANLKKILIFSLYLISFISSKKTIHNPQKNTLSFITLRQLDEETQTLNHTTKNFSHFHEKHTNHSYHEHTYHTHKYNHTNHTNHINHTQTYQHEHEHETTHTHRTYNRTFNHTAPYPPISSEPIYHRKNYTIFKNNYNNSIVITLSEKVNSGVFYLFPKGLRSDIFIDKIIHVSNSDNSEREIEDNSNSKKYRISRVVENDKIIIKFSNKIEDATELFKGARYIKRVNLNKLDFSIMKSMKSMFESCDYLKIAFVQSIHAPLLKDMSSLFENCIRLLNVEIRYFYAPELETLSKMFKNCKNLSVVNLSKLHTKILNDMSEMFKDCTDLDTVDLSNIICAQRLTMEKMFENCDSLDNVFMDYFSMSTECDCEFLEMFDGIDDLDEVVISVDNANLPTEFLDVLYYSDVSVVGNQNYTEPYGDNDDQFNEDDMDDFNHSGMDEDDIYQDDNGNDEGVDIKETVNNTFPSIENYNSEVKTTIKKKKLSTKGIIGVILALAVGILVLAYTMVALVRCKNEVGDAIPVRFSSSM